ncbi:MAG: formylglycine-generating enzyme family protein [Vicinamibacterales bacterium]
MVFARLEPGTFTMGTPENETGREPQEQQHPVRLSDAFWLGVFEVTQHEWQAVMGTNPSHFPDPSGRRPVENVTWVEVHRFLDRLTARAPGNRFRLPTEAEWEYACRAGTTGAYGTGPAFGPPHGNVAASITRSMAGDGQTTEVGAFPPNAWGLHDMQGNVWEWTADAHCPYPDGAVVDPAPACDSPLKVIRGGSWYFEADSARCGLRYTHNPDDRGFSLGFRVVREPLPSDADGH